MLTASGANFGFLRTLPHMLGILGGCFLLFAGIALGLGLLFERYPLVQTILRVVGSGYSLYLAWRIATAPPPDLWRRGEGRPLLLAGGGLPVRQPQGLGDGAGADGRLPARPGQHPVNAPLLAGFAELVALPCIALWAGLRHGGSAAGSTRPAPGGSSTA